MPRGLRCAATPGTSLEFAVVWVGAGIRPSSADDGAVEGAGELPLVLVAEGLAYLIGDVERRGALLQSFAAVVATGLFPEFVGEVGLELLYRDGVGGGVATDSP